MLSPNFNLLKIINAVGLAISACHGPQADLAKITVAASGESIEDVEVVIERLFVCNVIRINTSGILSITDIDYFDKVKNALYNISVICAELFSAASGFNISLVDLSDIRDFMNLVKGSDFTKGISRTNASENLLKRGFIDLMVSKHILCRTTNEYNNLSYPHMRSESFLNIVTSAYANLLYVSMVLNIK